MIFAFFFFHSFFYVIEICKHKLPFAFTNCHLQWLSWQRCHWADERCHWADGDAIERTVKHAIERMRSHWADKNHHEAHNFFSKLCFSCKQPSILLKPQKVPVGASFSGGREDLIFAFPSISAKNLYVESLIFPTYSPQTSKSACSCFF